MASIGKSPRRVRPARLFDLSRRSGQSVPILPSLSILAAGLFAVLTLGPAGYILVVPILIVLTNLNMQLALQVYVASVFFQSLGIALLMSSDLSGVTFQAAQAFNIIMLLVLAIYSLSKIIEKRGKDSHKHRLLILFSIPVGLVILLFSFYALNNASFSSIAGYIRIYFLLILGIFVGIANGVRINYDLFCKFVIKLTALAVFFGILEIVFPYWFYTFFNVVDFVNMKFQGVVDLRNVNDLMRLSMRPILNLSGRYGSDLQIVRPSGTTIHSISYSYCIAFGAAIALINRRWQTFWLLVPILVFVGSKGALTLVVTLLIIHHAAKTGSYATAFRIFVAWMAVFVVVTLIYGRITSDYHYLGLQGGITGFLNQPLGRGVGIGGNLSDLGRSDAKDFQTFQKLGAADFALESGIGVVLYQMGVFGFAFLYLWFAAAHSLFSEARSRVLGLEDRRACMLIGFGLLTLLVGSLFQEESLSPAALGLWTILTTMALARVTAFQRQMRNQHGNGPVRSALQSRAAPAVQRRPLRGRGGAHARQVLRG